MLAITLAAILASTQASPSDAQDRRWFGMFLAAHNDGAPAALERFCDEFHRAPGVDLSAARTRCGGYLTRYRQRYGPSRLVQEEVRPSGRYYWLEGERTHAVWGIRFPASEADPSKLDGVSVMEGVYPDGYPSPTPVAPSDTPVWLDRHFTGLTEAGLFSGVVLVARGDDLIFHRAFGLADVEAGRPMTTDTPSNVASVGKIFTAATALALVEQGRLDLDAPIATYLPRYPERVGSQVTLRHLLTHTSGVELDDYEPFLQARDAATSLQQIIDAQSRYIEHMNEGRYADFKPLGSFDYSNEEFDLIGALLEAVEGKPWFEVVREQLLIPAGANVAFETPDDAATGYTTLEPGDGEPVWGYALHPRSREITRPISPAGMAYADAASVFRVMRWIEKRSAENPLFSLATRQQVSDGEAFGVQLGYGLGFETEGHRCFRSFGHTGTLAGYNAVARAYPDSDLTIVILANRNGVAMDAASYLERVFLQCAGG